MWKILFTTLLLMISGSGNAYGGKAEPPLPEWASALEIDRVEIKGASKFPTANLESLIEVVPGDHFERNKVLRGEDSLANYYRLHGYEEVKIQSRLVRKGVQNKSLTLEMDINEGRPDRVTSIQIKFFEADPVPLTPNSPEYKFREKWKKKIKRAFPLREEGILDQEKLTDGKRAIQELLSSNYYMGSKIESNYTAAKKPSDVDTARWLDLTLTVDLGEKIKFGFRGNIAFTLGYLDGIVDEMRLLGLGKDYTTAIKARIEEEYRSAGYAHVEVTPYSVENSTFSTSEGIQEAERQVSFSINEGSKVKIAGVEFDGNLIFSSAELREKFYSKASSLIQNKIYVEKESQKAAELVVEYLKEKGYLGAKLIAVNKMDLPTSKVHQENQVKILIYLYEGDQTILREISATGAKIFNNEEIEKLLNVKVGAPLNLFSFEEGVEALKRAYRERGYLSFRILNEGPEGLIQYSQENRASEIVLDLSEGPLFHVSRIEIEGLENTKEYIVARELLVKEGEILKESQIVGSERQLRRLSIFSNVAIRTLDDPNKQDYKIVRVTLREADRGILTWGPGIRNDLGIRLFGQLAYTNLWGMNHTAAVYLSANRRFYNYHFAEGQGQLSYLWPSFLLPGMTFRPSIFIGQTQYINFAAYTLTAATLWEKPLFISPLLTGSFGYTLERINQFNAVDNVDNQQLLIGTVTPKLTLDLRDNPLSPTKGVFLTGWFDFSHPGIGTQSDLGYYRAQFRADYYQRIFKEIIGYVSIRTGYERSLITDPVFQAQGDTIPLIKQFALGGIGSVRGYQEQEINVQNEFFGTSLSYMNYRTQIDFPFAGALKLGVFLDAANLLVDSFSLGGLLYGAGFGFHYQTPVGPVSFDWGFKLNPLPGADPYVIHFSVGVI